MCVCVCVPAHDHVHGCVFGRWHVGVEPCEDVNVDVYGDVLFCTCVLGCVRPCLCMSVVCAGLCAGVCTCLCLCMHMCVLLRCVTFLWWWGHPQVYRPLASLDRELKTVSDAFADLKGLRDLLDRKPLVTDPRSPRRLVVPSAPAPAAAHRSPSAAPAPWPSSTPAGQVQPCCLWCLWCLCCL